MSKAVLLSIHPKWCSGMLCGEKTNEIRKTKPTIEVPFKVLIYCTKATQDMKMCFVNLRDTKISYFANGKVIGEFICDRIDRYESEFCNNDCYEDIRRIFLDEDGEEDFEKIWDNESDDYENFVFPHSCVSYQELKKYIGIGFKTFYAWHISNLKIYDKPKYLSEFKKPCKYPNEVCEPWCERARSEDCKTYTIVKCNNKLTKPPQSWCYVEE
jgi:predicted transcriptional regulator